MINLGPGPQDCVGNCENVSGINGTKGRFLGRVSRVCADTSNGVILRKIERSREVRSYADVALEGKHWEAIRAIDTHNFSFIYFIKGYLH